MNRYSKFLCFIFLFTFLTGCEKDSPTPTQPVEGIPANLFPLEIGRKWIYDYKETDTLGQPISSRSGTFITTVVGSITLAGKTAFVVVDSTIIANTVEVDTTYAHIDANGNFWQYMLFDSQQPEQGPGWLMVLNRQAGLNVEHTIFDTTVTMPEPPYNVRIRITSVIKNKVSLTVPFGTFNDAYPGEMRIQISYGIVTVQENFYMWLVPNVGPIKSKEPAADFGQPTTGYKVRELRSKNF